jgi:hypothetical protein
VNLPAFKTDPAGALGGFSLSATFTNRGSGGTVGCSEKTPKPLIAKIGSFHKTGRRIIRRPFFGILLVVESVSL